MLSMGVNVKKVDFNRKTVLVYHITDDVTGKPIPICGAKADNLIGGADIDWILANIDKPDFNYGSDDDDIFCSRCKKVQLASGSEDEKSKKRLHRFEQKMERKRRVATYEAQLVARYLGKCPRCGKPTETDNEIDDLFANTFCKNCDLKWSFIGSAKHTGEFSIRVHDEARKHVGHIRGLINEPGAYWEWR